MVNRPTLVNGTIVEDLLATLPGKDGDDTPHRADRRAVASYDRLRSAYFAALEVDLLPSDGYSCYRTLADQQHMHDLNLTTVAVGKSIHGEALAVDFHTGDFGST